MTDQLSSVYVASAAEPLRTIAERYALSHSSLSRHKLRCIPRDLMQARLSKQIAAGDFLAAKACELDRAAAKIYEQANPAHEELRPIVIPVRA